MKHAAAWPWALGILLGSITSAGAAVLGPTGTYAVVKGGDAGFEQSVVDGSLVSYQSGAYQATAQAAFGVNRVYAGALGASGGIEAGSVWSEQFTVDAPLGQLVTVTVRVHLSGTNSAPFSVFDGGGEYDLLFHTDHRTPLALLALLAQIDEPDNAAVIKVSIDQSLDDVLLSTFEARGGESFYLSSVLDIFADQDQVLDFSHSAHFGISVDGGASLLASSGTVYAAAVPEMGAAWLAVAGLGVLGGLVRPRRHAA